MRVEAESVTNPVMVMSPFFSPSRDVLFDYFLLFHLGVVGEVEIVAMGFLAGGLDLGGCGRGGGAVGGQGEAVREAAHLLG